VTNHHIEVIPLSGEHWVVKYEGDPQPLVETAHRREAEAEARLHARNFGEPLIHIQGLNGSWQAVPVDPDFPAPTPADVKGPHVEP
jgi:hypothetical protein